VIENRDHGADRQPLSTGVVPRPVVDPNEYYANAWGVPLAGSWPELFDDIVDRVLDADPKIEKVLDAACGSGLLVRAFRKRGIQAYGCDISAEAVAAAPQEVQSFCQVREASEPLDERYDVIVCINAIAENRDESATLRPLIAATDTLLFAETAGASDAIARSADALEWMERFAGFGFAPSLGFSTPMLGECAMLLRRSQPLPAEVMRLLAENLKFRAASVAPRSASGNAVELARAQERAHILEVQLAREREYLETLRGTHAFLIQEIQKLRSGAPETGAGGVPVDMDTIVARVREEIGAGEGLGGSAQGEIWRLAQEQTDLRTQMARLERRTTGSERSIQQVSNSINEILTSRIWQTLVSAGGFILRLRGRAKRG
jgi:SAM-dependent methyltransferase